MHQPVQSIGDAAMNKVEVARTETYSDKICLGNLYLHHVLAFVNQTKVISCEGEVEPDEQIMRKIEWDGAIQEDQCCNFRKQVAAQFRDQRMDLLYNKLEEVFAFFVIYEKDLINKWFIQYPHAMPIVKV